MTIVCCAMMDYKNAMFAASRNDVNKSIAVNGVSLAFALCHDSPLCLLRFEGEMSTLGCSDAAASLEPIVSSFFNASAQSC